MVRKGRCVPRIALLLLLCGCGTGETGEDRAEALRQPFRQAESCTMEAVVRCGTGTEEEISFTVRCEDIPGGAATVDILSPETVAGIRAVISGEELVLIYEGDCLNAGTLGGEEVSPAMCLPLMMDALREGWLLEYSEETCGAEGADCLRVTLDQTGEHGGKLLSTLWLQLTDGAPVRGELSVDGEIILTAEFTSFRFGAILNPSGSGADGAPPSEGENPSGGKSLSEMTGR